MIKSKKFQDYFEARLEVLKPDSTVSFDVYLYFPLNRHILHWMPSGESLSQEFILRYAHKGLHKFFVHNSDREQFERYIAGQTGLVGVETPPDLDAIAGTAEPPKKYQKKVEDPAVKVITEALNSEALTPVEKEAVVAETAKDLLKDALNARDPDDQKKKNKKLRESVKEILKSQGQSGDPAQSQIWALTEVDNTLEHSANVATYGVILAMAFGKVDTSLINDIASAGLMHDIGMAFVPHQVASKHIKNASPAHLDLYKSHVTMGSRLLDTYAPKTAPRVKTIIAQHHEKFDGSGFPKALKGFKVDDVASLLSIADLLDSVGSGQYDGQKRTFQESFVAIEKLEQTRTFPEYFNPEIFGVVMKFVKESASAETVNEATQLVESKKAEVVGAKR